MQAKFVFAILVVFAVQCKYSAASGNIKDTLEKELEQLALHIAFVKIIINHSREELLKSMDHSVTTLMVLQNNAHHLGLDLTVCPYSFNDFSNDAIENFDKLESCLKTLGSIVAETGKEIEGYRFIAAEHKLAASKCGSEEVCLEEVFRNVSSAIVIEPMNVYLTSMDIQDRLLSLQGDMIKCRTHAVANFIIDAKRREKNIQQCVKNLFVQ